MTTFGTSREIAATPEQIFAAFSDTKRLARWWGPAGFTNTFSLCEFKKGGRWVYVMHGPDGRDYPNESVFAEIAPSKIVIEHVSQPKYRLTIGLASSPAGTVVSWHQVFESPDIIRSRMEPIIAPANEQNLDRLTAEVLRERAAK